MYSSIEGEIINPKHVESVGVEKGSPITDVDGDETEQWTIYVFMISGKKHRFAVEEGKMSATILKEQYANTFFNEPEPYPGPR